MLTYRKGVRLAAAVLALTFAVGCDDDDDDSGTNPQTQTARVRIVNLASSAATAGLFANGVAVGSNVGFGSAAGSCVNVPVGQSLTFRAGNGGTTDLATIPAASLAANQNYTIVLYNSGSGTTARVLSDAGFSAPTTGNNALRFFNATGTAGDVYVTTSGGALGSTPSSGNLASGTATSGSNAFMSFSNTNNQIRFFNVGSTSGTPRVNTTFSSSNLSSTGVGNVFLTESMISGTTTNATVVSAPCSAS